MSPCPDTSTPEYTHDLPDQPVGGDTPTIFAEVSSRGKSYEFGILPQDRRSHIYILGKTGTGKSTLLKTFMYSDLKKGNGFALLDPHGDLAEDVKRNAPWSRKDDIIDFDATDPQQPYGINPFSNVPESSRTLACSGMMQVFKHLWTDSWGPRLEHILRNAILALLDHPGSNLSDILRILTDNVFRREVTKSIANEQVRDFWSKEYEGYTSRLRTEAISPVQNKVGAFLSDPLLKRILTAPEKPLNLRKIMDEGKILVVNLAKGKLGDDTANLLGSLLISRFDLAALSRANVPESERKDFTVYLDEFHNFTTKSLELMLSELRKYRLSLVLANQYLYQLEPRIREAVLGNAGTIISFRLGAKDATELAREFHPEVASTDLVSLPNFNVYMKMMIDGSQSRPFSAKTFVPKINS
ncbi:MAG: DUF87 domain-containing protein [Acidobacteria bacterium]|nr:MAG: DUF87 domain-containing protein [Acidobacteriota bacterium]REJ98284.1 MAG: DUF87 domain-containing protein [Acidobacteriota bacterium]REK17028.1 MAG: DUF87 domain-containing protein [Acidobacteriota bacterium]REK42938.1 MAG: DUF87 domain-containing protein [Acidobacteriota bacterium]